MTDDETKKLTQEPEIRYLIEFRPADDPERVKYKCTPNYEHAKKLAKEMTPDSKSRSVLLHRIVIEETFIPVTTVDFQKKEQEDNAQKG